MEDIVAMIQVIDWIADDIHYNTRGPKFYGMHLMADRMRDFSGAVDALKEKYWLGFLNTTPPSGKYFSQKAISLYAKYENMDYLEAMDIAAGDLVSMVQSATGDNGDELPRGVNAILDEISSQALLCKFFSSSSMDLSIAK